MTPVTITSRAPVRHSYSAMLPEPNVGVGLFERDGWSVGDRGDRTVTLTRTSGPSRADDVRAAASPAIRARTRRRPRDASAQPGGAGVDRRRTQERPASTAPLLTLDNPTCLATRIACSRRSSRPRRSTRRTTSRSSRRLRCRVPRCAASSIACRRALNAFKSTLEVHQSARVQLAMMRPDTRTASPQHVVATTTGRGGGGGGGAPTNLPKETYVVTDPMPGVWEIRLTDIEDTRSFDWAQAEKGEAGAADAGDDDGSGARRDRDRRVRGRRGARLGQRRTWSRA